MERVISDVHEAVQNVPEPLRESACTLRVRVTRARRDIAMHKLDTPSTDAAGADELAGKLRGILAPGDQVRVEWLDGAGVPLTGAGRRAAWTVPIAASAASAGPASPPPAPPPPGAPASTTSTVDRTRPAAAELFESVEVAAPLERVPVVPLEPGSEAGAVLGAGMAQLAATMKASQTLHDRQFTMIDRLVGEVTAMAKDAQQTARVAVVEVARVSGSYAGAQGKATEALGNATTRMGEALASTAKEVAGGDAEERGALVGLLEDAHEREVELARGAGGGGGGGEDGEDGDRPAPKGDPKGTIEALTGLVKEGKDLVRGASKDAAKAAVGELLEDLAGDGELPPEIAKAIKGLDAAKKAKVGAKLMAAMGGA